MVLWVVDAHTTYQQGMNIESLAREGYSALVVKATQGRSGYWAPTTFDSWIRRARTAGMVTGAYHWLNNDDPVAQVDYFLSRLSTVGGPAGMLAAVDCEDTSNPATQDTVRTFISRWNTRTSGHPLFFYSGAWWYQPHLDGFNVASLGVRGWNSHYVSGSGYGSVLYQKVPASWWNPGYGGFARSKMLQFTDQGTAGGITAHLDIDAFDGTLAELRALTGAASAAPTPPPTEPEPDDLPESTPQAVGIDGRMGMSQRANQESPAAE
ncbi:GH25 family lysozyme [Mangrovihabitans endophyticus]|uniref:Lyzozyme M1 (1,4-beta-N-acetylmuramidase), GH25 family n=1 Tax=Mangrovihabitans endophyticus TaxID=1751298 RepID=A0A8J3BXL8_9ACTN|nr:GH25 family lysozyme [Mangrovihabitans endophyticus]GGK77040.1 hypothetical protein GCM10012284_08760 [Mangrovihabitans endophyticus]